MTNEEIKQKAQRIAYPSTDSLKGHTVYYCYNDKEELEIILDTYEGQEEIVFNTNFYKTRFNSNKDGMK